MIVRWLTFSSLFPCMLVLPALILSGPAGGENFDSLRAGVVRVRSSSGNGTGFVVRRDREGVWILTASHVTKGDPHPRVEFFQRRGSEAVAEVRNQEQPPDDPRNLALLRVTQNLPDDLAVSPLAQQDLGVDDEVEVIGFPQGAGPWARVRASVAAQEGRDFSLAGALDEGNSGSPVFRNGEVAGMVLEKKGNFGKAAPVSILKTTLEGWGIAVADREAAASTVESTGPAVSAPSMDCSYCPEMVRIPAGEFMMGSDAGDPDAQKDEKPRRRVRVGAFSLGKYEVTRAQFEAFADETGHRASDCWAWDGSKWAVQPGTSWRDPGFAQTGEHPAVCVSYEDAQAYIRWLNRRTGRSYRLPTEAEWEYAARAGTDAPRYWGGDEACRYANAADRTFKKTFPGWQVFDCDDGYVYTAPVGRFRPNRFGLYDMLGNAWEWVADCWHDSYLGAPAGPEAWTDGINCADRRRVGRGGSWNDTPAGLRSAFRNWGNPDFRTNFLGFRLAQD